MTYELLDDYNIKYIKLTNHKKSLIGKISEYLARSMLTYTICKKIKPDLAFGIADFYIAQMGKLLGFKSYVFTDTEHVKLDPFFTFPFSSHIVTPSTFSRNLGEKQIKYKGYHELAYLHPNHFTPDPNCLKFLKLNIGQQFVIIRFVSWDALHDIGHSGLSYNMKLKIVTSLSKKYKVFISSESNLPPELDRYRMNIPPDLVHDVLYYSSLYIGEGATMASECAVLGTPAIYVNSLDLGYIDEQRDKYGLIFHMADAESIISKSLTLLGDKKTPKKWLIKNRRLIRDKIDVTDFLNSLIEKQVSND